MPTLRHAFRPLLSAGFILPVAFACSSLVSLLKAQTPASDDPLLQPLTEFVRPAPGEKLPPSEEQFDQLLSTAATDSPVMREQKEMVSQVNADRFRSWMRHMPVITASYSAGAFYLAGISGASSSSFTPGGAVTLQASEPLWHWGAFDAQTQLGILTEEKAQNDAVLAYSKLCLDLRQRYYDLIVKKVEAATLALEVESAKDRLDKAQFLLKQGRTTSARVNELELDWQAKQLKQDEAAKKFSSQLADFRRLTGSRSFAAQDVPDHIFLPVVDQSNLQAQYQEFQKNGFNQSLPAHGAELEEKSIDRQITISNANRKPLFDLTASISQAPYINSANNGLKFGTTFFVGITGTWTIFDRGDSFAATQAFYAQKRLAESRLADTREQTFNDANQNLDSMGLGLRSLAVLKSEYQQQQDDYTRAKFLLQSGQADQAAVDDARDSLLDTRGQILSRQAEVATAYYGFLSDIFQDPALANAPPFTQSR